MRKAKTIVIKLRNGRVGAHLWKKTIYGRKGDKVKYSSRLVFICVWFFNNLIRFSPRDCFSPSDYQSLLLQPEWLQIPPSSARVTVNPSCFNPSDCKSLLFQSEWLQIPPVSIRVTANPSCFNPSDCKSLLFQSEWLSISPILVRVTVNMTWFSPSDCGLPTHTSALLKIFKYLWLFIKDDISLQKTYMLIGGNLISSWWISLTMSFFQWFLFKSACRRFSFCKQDGLHCPDKNLNLRIKTVPVTAWADATVYSMSGFYLRISGPELCQLLLHLLQQFLCVYPDRFWDSVGPAALLLGQCGPCCTPF